MPGPEARPGKGSCGRSEAKAEVRGLVKRHRWHLLPLRCVGLHARRGASPLPIALRWVPSPGHSLRSLGGPTACCMLGGGSERGLRSRL